MLLLLAIAVPNTMHEDFTKTNCSIVLETVFDNRIHLTEKTLRPIACGHPFMILEWPRNTQILAHLWISKHYSIHSLTKVMILKQIWDKRMIMVLSEMDRINKLPQADQDHIWKECAIIARRNKELFFSDRFFNSITQELRDNVLSI